ncbi:MULTISPECIES: hypothetical protein [unclassified Streptomyces]|uniref:hypothetical protein n=1 Tax=unclassified Streptomyces TaxID=2593676 RepID=UPI000DD5D845|nr:MULTISPECIES: hypothetical protein [unclassified Streptomyces]QZZ28827.1 hypothetical protein A7X85_23515 [Streptomyces sp. ST1015]
MSAGTLASQAAALRFLANLAETRPDLPGAYLPVGQHLPREVAVQLDSPGDVEAWREALSVGPEAVVADRIGGRPSLEFYADTSGLKFHVYAVYTPVAPLAGGAA